MADRQGKGTESRAMAVPACYYHKDEAIQNFCTSQSCCLPLCPKCIQTHIDEHDRQGSIPLIESYSSLVDRVQQALRSNATRLSHQLEELVQNALMQSKYSPKHNLTYYAETISKSKEVLFKQLGAFFDSLQLKIEDALKVQYDRLCTAGTETVEEQLRNTIEGLKKTEAEL